MTRRPSGIAMLTSSAAVPAAAAPDASPRKKRPFTTYIIIGMVLGIVAGWACHAAFPDPKTAASIAGYISLVADVFLRLIKMIIAPLVFSTLVVGIAHMGDTGSVGRVGVKALGWFVMGSLVSLLLGLILANILQPGLDIGLALPDATATTSLKTSSFTLKEFITHLVPKSVAEAMATNEILQIVVFSIFFGTRWLRSARPAGRSRPSSTSSRT